MSRRTIKTWRDTFESGHKTFDRIANRHSVVTGNVLSDVQTSFFIRPYTETECNGFTREPGHLRNFDLEPFRKIGTPRHVLDYVRSVTENTPVILYRFFHHNNNGDKIVHGYVVTTTDYELLKFFVTGPTYKSHNIIAEAIKFITAAPKAA